MATKWKSVSDGGDLLKWGDVAAGYELLGTYLGTKPGKFGSLGLLQAEDADLGLITFTLPFKLEAKLKKVIEGARVRIVYMGSVATADNKSMHQFDVQIPDDGVDDTEEVPF